MIFEGATVLKGKIDYVYTEIINSDSTRFFNHLN